VKKSDNIFIAGHKGLVGNAVYKLLKKKFVSIIDGSITIDINGSIEAILVISTNPCTKIPKKSIIILLCSDFENNK